MHSFVHSLNGYYFALNYGTKNSTRWKKTKIKLRIVFNYSRARGKMLQHTIFPSIVYVIELVTDYPIFSHPPFLVFAHFRKVFIILMLFHIVSFTLLLSLVSYINDLLFFTFSRLKHDSIVSCIWKVFLLVECLQCLSMCSYLEFDINYYHAYSLSNFVFFLKDSCNY